jgi:Mg-chelatase subunit ChlD
MIAAMGGGASWAVWGAPNCGQAVTVVAAPELVPVLKKLAKDDSGCELASVRAGESAEVSRSLGSGGAAPEVWIPEASVWADLAVAEGAAPGLRDEKAPSIARTPVIMAVRQELATKIADSGDQPTWNALAAGDKAGAANDLMVMLPDPRSSAAGLAAVNVAAAPMRDRADVTDAIADVVPDLRRSILPDGPALLDVLDDPRPDPTGAGRDPAVVATEQTVYARNAASPEHLNVGIYPPEGAMSLDYPYLVSVDDPAKQAAALAFKETLMSARGQAMMQEAGFRTGEGKAGPKISDRYGLRAEEPERIPEPPAEVTTQTVLSLRQLLAPTRTLFLVDTSASMGQPLPGTTDSRISMTAALVREGVTKLPLGSEAGVWHFASELDGDRDYKRLVAMGPVGENGQKIRGALGSLAGKVGGRAGLYDSILAAFRAASDSGDPAKPGTVLVVTDGRNDTDTGITLNTLVKALQKESDERRGVSIAVIGLGPDADLDELDRITEATSGKAYVARDFRAAKRVMLDVIARRI